MLNFHYTVTQLSHHYEARTYLCHYFSPSQSEYYWFWLCVLQGDDCTDEFALMNTSSIMQCNVTKVCIHPRPEFFACLVCILCERQGVSVPFVRTGCDSEYHFLLSTLMTITVTLYTLKTQNCVWQCCVLTLLVSVILKC